MKHLILSLLLVPALTAPAFSQAFEAEAILSLPEDGGTFRAWILAASKTQIRYKTTKVSTDFVDAKTTDYATIFLVEPPDYAAAIDLYEGRKYKEAQEAFAAVKERCKPIAAMPDNFHTLAAFHEMECFRHLGDYEGLAAVLKSFTSCGTPSGPSHGIVCWPSLPRGMKRFFPDISARRSPIAKASHSTIWSAVAKRSLNTASP
jgi:hypothetical protein